jgi:hypothetical protein
MHLFIDSWIIWNCAALPLTIIRLNQPCNRPISHDRRKREREVSAHCITFNAQKSLCILFSHEIVLPLPIKKTYPGGIYSANRLDYGAYSASGSAAESELRLASSNPYTYWNLILGCLKGGASSTDLTLSGDWWRVEIVMSSDGIQTLDSALSVSNLQLTPVKQSNAG